MKDTLNKFKIEKESNIQKLEKIVMANEKSINELKSKELKSKELSKTEYLKFIFAYMKWRGEIQ